MYAVLHRRGHVCTPSRAFSQYGADRGECRKVPWMCLSKQLGRRVPSVCIKVTSIVSTGRAYFTFLSGMLSPLLGIAGVNSLLFASYGLSKRIVTPFGELSLPQTALAGAMAGAVNAILASPGIPVLRYHTTWEYCLTRYIVEMFKVRMQGQYGSPSDQRLSVVFREMWSEWGFRKGVMRGYWVQSSFLSASPHVS